jgi:two-component system OmpR family response regulator
MGTPAPRRRVLIVDDDEAMRLLLAKIVQQDLDAEVTLAGTCEAALRFARESAYDAILLDLMMPGMGGVGLLERIRTDSANRSTPVVVVSILVDSPDERRSGPVRRAKALGAAAVLSKPVDRSSLVAALKEQFVP